jgi:Zn-dependent M28 family amino/carboxypeptidase
MNQTIVDSLIINKIPSSFSTNVSALKTAENVLGFIPGKSDEIIVLSAHYDHIGYDNGEICNGADDDGSGTSALLEIAKTFQKAYDSGVKPQRGILFLSVSGEEKGLFGSQFYTDHPVFPLSKTTTNLNIDMVGRQDTVQENNNYIYLIGADRISNELHEISENINDQYINFKLDYTYNDKEDPNRFYERSDHYNFAKNNIPVIFYFGGLHEDYHKPTDDVEKIDFLKLEKVSRYVFLTAWELAYRKNAVQK